MDSLHVKRAVDILKEEGPVELSKSTYDYINRRIGYKPPLIREWQKKRLKDRIEIETDADPFKIIWVDPHQIQYMSGELVDERASDRYHIQYIKNQSRFGSIESFGKVENGDWDTSLDEVAQLAEYKGIKQRYVDGKSWEETDFFRLHLESINKYGSSHGCGSKEELLQECRRYECLVENIEKNGYKTQNQLGIAKLLNEVTVNIGRSGELLFIPSGRHRLCAAKVLKLEQIPVMVKTRHALWQETREDIYKNGLSGEHQELRDHPDLQDILN